MTDSIRRLETPNLAPVTATPAPAGPPAPSLAPEIAPRLSRDALTLPKLAPPPPATAGPVAPQPVQPQSSAQALVFAARQGHSGMQLSPRELAQWTSKVDKLRQQGRTDGDIQKYLAACFGCSYENQARVGFSGPVPSLRDATRREPVQRHEVPYISQRQPAGAGPDYRNGPMNCSPTSMAMIARAYGYRPDLNDARLITHLADIAGTNQDGTTFPGLLRMGQAMGRPLATSDQVPEPYWVGAQLEKGALVVAIGNPTTFRPGSQTFPRYGHAIAVVGIDAFGRYLVHDPDNAQWKHAPLTPHQLQFFIQSTMFWHSGAVAVF